MNSKADFIVIANRLPVEAKMDENGNSHWVSSPGGLVAALVPMMKTLGGAWIGWDGTADTQIEPFNYDGYQVVPIPISEQEIHDYYEGFSNGTIWPLYHDGIVLPSYHREWWDAYKKINLRFTEETAKIASPGATVWVHDYQLQLVPAMLRRLRPDLKIGYFLHIPFPPLELYVQLPWRREIVEGLLGADLVGFQVPDAASNFQRLAKRLLGTPTKQNAVQLPNGRIARVGAYPISINAEEFRNLSNSAQVKERESQLRAELGYPKIVFVGIDRLDYTKGLRHRVKAFGELFTSELLDPKDCVFLQVATPTRERVEEYMKLRDNIDLMVGRINSMVGTIARPAIIYRHQSFGRKEIAALYRLADVMVVTPLRDGMNLVAKEYVAAHGSYDGALVLSEFAGAARELRQSYLVNPYDTNSLKENLVKAATEPISKRRSRMRRLTKQVFDNTVDSWAAKFLNDLNKNT